MFNVSGMLKFIYFSFYGGLIDAKNSNYLISRVSPLILRQAGQAGSQAYGERTYVQEASGECGPRKIYV